MVTHKFGNYLLIIIFVFQDSLSKLAIHFIVNVTKIGLNSESSKLINKHFLHVFYVYIHHFVKVANFEITNEFGNNIVSEWVHGYAFEVFKETVI